MKVWLSLTHTVRLSKSSSNMSQKSVSMMSSTLRLLILISQCHSTFSKMLVLTSATSLLLASCHLLKRFGLMPGVLVWSTFSTTSFLRFSSILVQHCLVSTACSLTKTTVSSSSTMSKILVCEHFGLMNLRSMVTSTCKKLVLLYKTKLVNLPPIQSFEISSASHGHHLMYAR